jgi:hypothetical protein
MPRGLGRLIVAIAAALGVWLVAMPAFAGMSAPQCDPRGAITFAPPPQLQPPEQSLDAFDPTPTCIEKLVADAGVEQGNVPLPSSAPEPALAASTPAVPPALPASILPADVPRDEARPGVRARLDRPPRG